MNWKQRIKSALGLTVDAEHLPDIFQKPAPAQAKPAQVRKDGPVLVDLERNVWAFPSVKATTARDAQPLTDDELRALVDAGITNAALANRVKQARAEGLTQQETATRTGVSLSYIKKIGGVLSRFEVQSGTIAG